MSTAKKPIVVTAALPYANGSVHLGHMVEHVLTDVFVRAMRLAGEEAYYFCADDTHGTPIESNARKAGVTPEAFVARFAAEHVEDFEAFGIGFDHYHSTNSEENRRWVHEIYGALKAKGHVEKRVIQQLFDFEAQRFLPDRFVKGECPNCGSADQYGDACEICGKTYDPTDLKNPKSVFTGSTPVLRDSEHMFVSLAPFAALLRDWVRAEGRVNAETLGFVDAWLEGGLKDWCISRDAPYFGFQIPGEPDGAPPKYFYVWLDAPIGYISSSDAWGQKTGRSAEVEAWWRRGGADVIHVIGKDIVYFHTLFWPAMLHAAGLTLPRRVQVHGMLTVDGTKMSKSRGTFINASTFRKHLDPAYFRYFIASKLSSGAGDIDLSGVELVNKVNAELVNNFANLTARGAPFLAEAGYGTFPDDAGPHLASARACVDRAEAAYRRFDHAEAVQAALELTTLGNKLFQDAQPWKLVKEGRAEDARRVVTLCLNLARAATVILAPVVPSIAARVYAILGLPGLPKSFDEARALDLVNRPIGRADRVVDRIEKKTFDAIVADSVSPEAKAAEEAKAAQAAAAKAAKKAPAAAQEKHVETPKTDAPTPPAAEAAPARTEITIDDFAKVELRVAHVVKAETVDGADKLLKLTVDLAEGRHRTIFAGIRSAYTPEQVEGRKVVVVANLKPRKMRFGLSEGMVLAAGPGGKEIWLLDVPSDTPIGAEVK